jgi:hypothetical protein
MKAISLWQPWATLVALGVKQFETRHWTTNHRGPLAIHAAKRPALRGELNMDILNELENAGFEHLAQLPYGCIVCTVTLAAVYPTDQAVTLPFFDSREYSFGNYAPGRYAWRLDNVQLVDNLPARGSQGFWEVEL